MTSKRTRLHSSSLSSSQESSSSPSSSPTAKLSRTTTDPTSRPLICTLPPTCNRRPTHLNDTNHLETHYATYHAQVCQEPGCACVFPDPRLLELHQIECHDPLAAIRKERGDRIFGCHLATCKKNFLTPKARRLHLIQGHGYPKEYFFAVTNKGVGGLLRKWGEGVSMIRGEWKDRHQADGKDSSMHDSDSEGEDDDNEVVAMKQQDRQPLNPPQQRQSTTTSDVDKLAEAMSSSLHLVPSSVRFGRGTQHGAGFAHHSGARGHQHARGGRGGILSKPQAHEAGGMDVDPSPGNGSRGRGVPRGIQFGRGGRGQRRPF